MQLQARRLTCQYLAAQRSMQLFSPTFKSASLNLRRVRTVRKCERQEPARVALLVDTLLETGGSESVLANRQRLACASRASDALPEQLHAVLHFLLRQLKASCPRPAGGRLFCGSRRRHGRRWTKVYDRQETLIAVVTTAAAGRDVLPPTTIYLARRDAPYGCMDGSKSRSVSIIQKILQISRRQV